MVSIDGTGVGRAVTELLDNRLRPTIGLVPITWTGAARPGGKAARPTVPKSDLLSGLQLALEQKRLSIPVCHSILVEELLAFRARQTPSGQLTGQASPGAHDDLIAALPATLSDL